jgi:hypothetical protein
LSSSGLYSCRAVSIPKAAHVQPVCCCGWANGWAARSCCPDISRGHNRWVGPRLCMMDILAIHLPNS